MYLQFDRVYPPKIAFSLLGHFKRQKFEKKQTFCDQTLFSRQSSVADPETQI